MAWSERYFAMLLDGQIEMGGLIGALLSPLPSVFARCGLHPPSGRVEGEERALGEGGCRLDRCSNHPPRKLAKARFRPSLWEGEIVAVHSSLLCCFDATHP
jgi:hypothetical protein